MDRNELSDPPVAKQLQALNTDLRNHTHYAIAIIITLEGNKIMNTEKSRRRLRVIWLLISFNEDAPSSEDGEKLQNLSNHLGKKSILRL